MKTSRSLLSGYSKPCAFFILFTMVALVGTDTATMEPSTAVHSVSVESTSVPHTARAEQKANVSTTPGPGKHSGLSVISPTVISPTVPKSTAESLFSTSGIKGTTSASKLPTTQTYAVTARLVSHLKNKEPFNTSTAVPSLSHPEPTSAAQEIREYASEASTSSGAGIPNTTAQTVVKQEYPRTTGKKEASSETTATVSTALRVPGGTQPTERPTLVEEETKMTTAATQGISDNITTSAAGQNLPGVSENEPKPDSAGANSSGKNYTIIILIAAFCILCLLAITVFLYRRRRHRSGSTSFNTAGWAGQVALPDDSGLEKDVEPGTVTPSGEGEARRNTLVTFFGKRQSRVPSVAMEDISGKREGEECQQLLDGDDDQGAGPEGSGEANGKLPEPAKQSSEGASTPGKPEGGSS